MTKIQRTIAAVAAAGGLAWASAASAQIPFTNVNPGPDTQGVPANRAFPLQNLQGPQGINYQTNYPYPGQCVADKTNNGGLFPTLLQCAAGSFAGAAGVSERTDGGWAGTGLPTSFKVVQPVIPSLATPKFVYEVLNPMDYTPDTTTYPGAHLYVLGVHESWGAQNIASAGTAAPSLGIFPPFGLFPDPATLGLLCGPAGAKVACAIPNGMQWTGLTCQPPPPLPSALLLPPAAPARLTPRLLSPRTTAPLLAWSRWATPSSPRSGASARSTWPVVRSRPPSPRSPEAR